MTTTRSALCSLALWTALFGTALGCGAAVSSDALHTDASERSPDARPDGRRAPHEDIPAVFRCEAPSDCGVTHASCCGTCGVARRGDAVAVNTAHYLARGLRRDGCGGAADAVACPACASPIDPQLVATCRAHRCELVDLGAGTQSADERAEHECLHAE